MRFIFKYLIKINKVFLNLVYIFQNFFLFSFKVGVNIPFSIVNSSLINLNFLTFSIKDKLLFKFSK